MQPFSRETIVDRRQPLVRWSAVLAGAALAAGLWMLLQLIFTGGALSAIDPDEVEHVQAFGIGTSVGTVLAPLIAMFAGGWLGGRLAGYYDVKTAGLHGALVWALASVFGVVVTAAAFAALADRAAMAHADVAAPAPGTQDFVEDAVRAVNADLEAKGAPRIELDEFIQAAHDASARNRIDRAKFVTQLDAETKLSRPEAESALAALGDRAPDVIAAAGRLAQHRAQALRVAENAGNALLGAGLGLLLCGVVTVAGAVLAARQLRPKNRDYDRPDTMPGHPVSSPYPPPTTYPTTD
jgi:hypothetical protein